MRKINIFALSFFLSLGTSSALVHAAPAANNYELAPANKTVKLDVNTDAIKQISSALGVIADASKKALVFISVVKSGRAQQYVDPFDFFFSPDQRGPAREHQQEGFGSGQGLPRPS